MANVQTVQKTTIPCAAVAVGAVGEIPKNLPTGEVLAVGSVSGDHALPDAGREAVLADRLGARLTCQTVLQGLLALWFLPAAVQFVVGASAVFGLPAPGSDAIAQRVDLVWATVAILSLPTLLVGAMWAIRSWPSFPSGAEVPDRWAHGVGLTLCIACVPLLPMMTSLAPSLLPIVLLFMATCGFVVGLYPARWVQGVGSREAEMLAAFLMVMAFQLSIGWFHLTTWGSATSLLLACEGAALAVTSLGSVRAVSAMTANVGTPATEGVGVITSEPMASEAMASVGSMSTFG